MYINDKYLLLYIDEKHPLIYIDDKYLDIFSTTTAHIKSNF